MEKQLTAMSILRERAENEIAKINIDATFETKLGTQIKLNSEQRGRIISLQQMIDSIDTKLLATERQQLIDFGSKMQLVRDIDTDGNVTFAYDPEKQFDKTFKTQ